MDILGPAQMVTPSLSDSQIMSNNSNTMFLHILMDSSWQFVDHRLNVKRLVGYELGVYDRKEPPSHGRAPTKNDELLPFLGSEFLGSPMCSVNPSNAQPAENQ